MGLSKFPDAVQNIKRNKDLNHECKIFVEPKFASLTQSAFSRPLLFFTFILSISALLVWHFCFLKTFMKLQSKANEQKNNIIRKAVYARTPAHEPEVVFWVISSWSSIEIWFLCELTKTLSLRHVHYTIRADPHTWYLPENYINAIRGKWLNTKNANCITI